MPVRRRANVQRRTLQTAARENGAAAGVTRGRPPDYCRLATISNNDWFCGDGQRRYCAQGL